MTLAYTGSAHSTLKISCRFPTAYVIHRSPSVELFKMFCNMLKFCDEELLASCPTAKLEDFLLLALHDSLFSIFLATLHIWRPSPPSTTWGQVMSWWQEVSIKWCIHVRSFGTNCMIKCTLICEPVFLIQFHIHTEFLYNNCLRNVLQYLERLHTEYIQSCPVT